MIFTLLALALILGIFLYNNFIKACIAKSVSNCKRNDSGIMNGAEAIFLKADSRRAALLVHGFIGSPSDFGPLPSLLQAERYNVYAPLLPGHGTDPRYFSKVTPEDLEIFVRAEYRKLKDKYDEVVLVGFSMGGALSILTAAQERVDKLVLLAPYLKIKHRWFYILPAEWHNKIFVKLIPYVYRPLYFKQINKKENIPNIVDYEFVSLKGAATAIQIGGKALKNTLPIKQPCLLIHGRKDGATDFDASRSFAQSLNEYGSKFVELPKSNHMILWDYDSEIAQREIIEFLTGTIVKKEAIHEGMSKVS